jgi:two-component system, chemotaxis family, chemotaxis protein CheY
MTSPDSCDTRSGRELSPPNRSPQVFCVIFQVSPDCTALRGLLVLEIEPMKKILIVDDSPTIRRMVAASLKPLNDASFQEAGNGLEAIENLTREAIDLMILDLNMPGMHGLEVLRFMRSHERYRNIPIIVLTTKYDADSRATAIAGGASHYMTKPFEPGALLAQVSRFLN